MHRSTRTWCCKKQTGITYTEWMFGALIGQRDRHSDWLMRQLVKTVYQQSWLTALLRKAEPGSALLVRFRNWGSLSRFALRPLGVSFASGRVRSGSALGPLKRTPTRPWKRTRGPVSVRFLSRWDRSVLYLSYLWSPCFNLWIFLGIILITTYYWKTLNLT